MNFMNTHPLVPVERTDEHHLTKHAQILGLPDRPRYRILLVGDSLIRRWEDNPEQWNRYFGERQAANLGVGSDTLENLLWRIRHGELSNMAPEILVLLVGTNNLPLHSAQHIAAGLGQITREIRSLLPSTKVLVVGLFPRNPDGTGRDYPALIAAVNQAAASLDDGQGVFFRDFGSLFPRVDGHLDPRVMPDGLHLNAAGYDLWGPALASVLEEITQSAANP